MNELKESIARYLWLYLKESNPELLTKLSHEDVFNMADIAVTLTIKAVDGMLMKQIKHKLEKLISND